MSNNTFKVGSKINHMLKGVNQTLFLTISFGAILILKIILGIIFGDSFSLPEIFIESKTDIWFLSYAVILGPLLETLIFQFLIIRLILHFFKKTNYVGWYACFTSAIIFGSLHYYSFAYIIVALCIGLVLGYIYLLSIERKEKPILNTWLVHSANNLFAFILMQFIY
ncbi:MAG: lysostaphin resistance A-like protein [Hyphomicrobiales bacterium]